MENENGKKKGKVSEGRWGSQSCFSTKDQQKCSLPSTRKLQDVHRSTTSIQRSEIHSVRASAATTATEHVCTAVPYDPAYVWVETGHGHSSSHNN